MISNASVPFETDERSSPSLLTILAWLVVLTPLAWGIYNTVNTSSKLFSNSPPPAAQPTGAVK
jgi:hypothetical protein